MGEAQGADIQGRSIIVDYVGEKSQKGAKFSGNFVFVKLSLPKCEGCQRKMSLNSPLFCSSCSRSFSQQNIGGE